MEEGVPWVLWEFWVFLRHKKDRLNFSSSERGSFEQLKCILLFSHGCG